MYKKNKKTKGGQEYRTEHKRRSACNTGRKTGREENIHTRHRLIETGKQTRNGRGRRPRLLLVKRQGWEFTLQSTTQRLGRAEASLRGIFRSKLIKFADMPCGVCECVVECSCMQGCCAGEVLGGGSRRAIQKLAEKTKSTRVDSAARQS